MLNHTSATRDKVLIVEHLEEYLRRDVVGVVAGKHEGLPVEDGMEVHFEEVAGEDVGFLWNVECGMWNEITLVIILHCPGEALLQVLNALAVDLYHFQGTGLFHQELSHHTHAWTYLQYGKITVRLIYCVSNPLCNIKVSKKMLTQILLRSYLFHYGAICFVCKVTKNSLTIQIFITNKLKKTNLLYMPWLLNGVKGSRFSRKMTTFAPMEPKSILSNIAKILFPFILGGAILWWMYRGEDISTIKHVLTEEMNWTWMLLSFPFGILAQMFRGWRWKQTLEPMVEDARNVEGGRWNVEGGRRKEDTPSRTIQSSDTPIRHIRSSICIYAVFLSYAASLVIPRIGEFSRCAVLKRYEGISFSKALGTVVTERAVDTLIVMLYSGIILLIEISVFGTFFQKTGTSLDRILEGFSFTGWIVTAICASAVLILLHLLLKNLSIYNKVKMTLSGIWEGVMSLKGIKNLPLYLFFSVGIWVMYFLHYYLTFFCFDFTSELGIGCGLVSFVVANFAVIVPTPNGAGPWHFAIKTMLILYGVADEQALWFVLIVHTVQTMLVIALGVYAWMGLGFSKFSRKEEGGRRKENTSANGELC